MRESSIVVPDSDVNVCWCCNQRNISTATMCSTCDAHTTPTRDRNKKKVSFEFYSFGSKATGFNYTAGERLHRTIRDSAIQALDGNALVAIRVGDTATGTMAIALRDKKGGKHISIYRPRDETDDSAENRPDDEAEKSAENRPDDEADNSAENRRPKATNSLWTNQITRAEFIALLDQFA